MTRCAMLPLSLPLLTLSVSCGYSPDQGSSIHSEATTESCDVVVAGGSTAGVAAAIAAAREFEAEGSFQGRKRRTCLLEPTDWAGGQLTSSGVAAVDFAHHKVTNGNGNLNLSRLTRDLANNSRVFSQWMSAVAPANGNTFNMTENTGKCWVSVRCYEPEKMVGAIHETLNALAAKGYLKVYFNTVPVTVVRHSQTIKQIFAVQRTPRNAGERIWTRRLSSVIADWYDAKPSNVYDKKFIIFDGPKNTGSEQFAIFVDGTEWGDLLALGKLPYMQGVESSEATPTSTNETCGQAIVYPVAIELKAQETPLPSWFRDIESQIRYPGHYSINEPGKDFTWEDVWAYRRIRAGQGASRQVRGVPSFATGDISSQNWTLGNDFPYRYLFLPKSETSSLEHDWAGGLDIRALAEAEAHALGWFKYLREHAPQGLGGRLALSTANGTANGLSKIPYVRDTRRSVGMDDFVLKYDGGILQGTAYDDSIAIGAYTADVHATRNSGCNMPTHVLRMNTAPRPFQLPFRAHTNKGADNFLVAGKLMAQTFAASTATRVHPIEFSSGTGVGAAAAFMQKWQIGARHVLRNPQSMKDIQARITALHGPIAFQNLNAARE